ncbi:Thioesterase/thiol ester dehydrase-isomerase [Neocallimastix lanati (nom. inval.)]|uniref:Thioesterase/thiol ester dehydrase-isomerase n=1 Tax=Neocallimastix californiae TaxID=1754190 RepID=A0A1Y2CZ06_9FUNG|nr:Thioesterase/thiol ester dehydrase-isomerase [Neocallimastix sp. JGI-2020a]ORY52259.1 Thioesterase/thiol ester dehydrase-isomerase [Neocallimastix californiae]|eukprot:ORY52259.1 Thioesterase/thiol ester dehydrase-isomerase [Neocallimastix californiae]
MSLLQSTSLIKHSGLRTSAFRFNLFRNALAPHLSLLTLKNNFGTKIPKTPRTIEKSVENSKTKISQVLTPSQANDLGIASGGQVMCWIDAAAGITAKRHAVYKCVTASVDSVHFLNKIKLGDIAILTSKINRTWNTSMEVAVTVCSENLLSGVRKPCCQAYLTFVGVNNNGRPTPVPKILPITEEEKIEYERADIRKWKRIAQSKTSITREKAREKIFNYSRAPVSTWPGSIASSYTEMVEMVMPHHINPYGSTFGGQIMTWMENCALISASRYSRSPLITASMDAIHFILPIKNSDFVTVRSFVSAVYETSIEVFVTVEVEDHKTGKKFFANDGFITFVSVESKNHPVPTKVQKPVNGKVTFYNGLERRKHRLDERQQLIDFFNRKYYK